MAGLSPFLPRGHLQYSILRGCDICDDILYKPSGSSICKTTKESIETN